MGNFTRKLLKSSTHDPDHHMIDLVFPIIFFFLLQNPTLVSSLNYTKYRPVSSLRFHRIQTHLNKINKPPVITIQSPDGDIIDCVHKRKQPALDHPLLKNHKIQRVAAEMPKAEVRVREENSESEGETEKGAWQMWHRNGTRCPKGTIPIRRTSLDDVLRSKSLYDFGKKQHRKIPNPTTIRMDAPDVVSGNGHEVPPSS